MAASRRNGAGALAPPSSDAAASAAAACGARALATRARARRLAGARARPLHAGARRPREPIANHGARARKIQTPGRCADLAPTCAGAGARLRSGMTRLAAATRLDARARGVDRARAGRDRASPRATMCVRRASLEDAILADAFAASCRGRGRRRGADRGRRPFARRDAPRTAPPVGRRVARAPPCRAAPARRRRACERRASVVRGRAHACPHRRRRRARRAPTPPLGGCAVVAIASTPARGPGGGGAADRRSAARCDRSRRGRGEAARTLRDQRCADRVAPRRPRVPQARRVGARRAALRCRSSRSWHARRLLLVPRARAHRRQRGDGALQRAERLHVRAQRVRPRRRARAVLAVLIAAGGVALISFAAAAARDRADRRVGPRRRRPDRGGRRVRLRGLRGGLREGDAGGRVAERRQRAPPAVGLLSLFVAAPGFVVLDVTRVRPSSGRPRACGRGSRCNAGLALVFNVCLLLCVACEIAAHDERRMRGARAPLSALVDILWHGLEPGWGDASARCSSPAASRCASSRRRARARRFCRVWLLALLPPAWRRPRLRVRRRPASGTRVLYPARGAPSRRVAGLARESSRADHARARRRSPAPRASPADGVSARGAVRARLGHGVARAACFARSARRAAAYAAARRPGSRIAAPCARGSRGSPLHRSGAGGRGRGAAGGARAGGRRERRQLELTNSSAAPSPTASCARAAQNCLATLERPSCSRRAQPRRVGGRPKRLHAMRISVSITESAAICRRDVASAAEQRRTRRRARSCARRPSPWDHARPRRAW